MVNRNIVVGCKQTISAEIYFSTSAAVQYAAYDIVKIEPVSILHTTKMIDTNVTVDDDSQSFETPGKKHCKTEPMAQVLLGSDSIQHQQNNTACMTGLKLSSYEKQYICFQTDRNNYQVEH